MTGEVQKARGQDEEHTAQALEHKLADHSNVIIHVGRHKAASTFLQHEFFPQLTQKLCIEKAELFRLLGEQEFDAERFRQFVTSNFRQFRRVKCLNRECDDLLILSREGLSFSKSREISRFSKNLKQSYPNARVVCIIREQFSLLLTLYVWHTGKRFLLRSLGGYLRDMMNSPDAAYLHHNEVIRTYMDAFGKDRVLVIPYELLKVDKQAFLRHVVDFIDPRLDYQKPDGRLNISYKTRAVVRGVIVFNVLVHLFFFLPYRLLRALGLSSKTALFARIEYRLKKFSRKKLSAALNWIFPNSANVALKAEHFETYAELFAQINSDTEQLTGLDLAEYGYITQENLKTFVQQRSGMEETNRES